MSNMCKVFDNILCMLLVGIWDNMSSQGHHYCHWPRLDKSSVNAWFGLGYPREIMGDSLTAVSADVAVATRQS
jgi:hypothetical protein